MMKIAYIGSNFELMQRKFPALVNSEIHQEFYPKDFPMLMIEGEQTSNDSFSNLEIYLKSGGRLLLIGKATKILQAMDIEYMAYSSYAVQEGGRLSGFKVKDMAHPIFEGFHSEEIPVSDVTAYITLEAGTYMRPSGNILAKPTIANSTQTVMTEYEYESGRIITFAFEKPTPYNVDALYEENLMKIYQNVIHYLCGRDLLETDLHNQKMRQKEVEYVDNLAKSEIQPEVRFEKRKIEPYRNKRIPTQLLRRSVHYAEAGLAMPKQKYEPIETGGFTIKNGLNYFNKPIVDGMNKLFTSDRPKFRTSIGTGTGSIDVDYRCFPVAGRSMKGSMYDHDLGTLSLGTFINGKIVMFNDFENIQVWFLPGVSRYVLSHKDSGKIYLVITHARRGYGFILSVSSDKEHEFFWNFGNIK